MEISHDSTGRVRTQLSGNRLSPRNTEKIVVYPAYLPFFIPILPIFHAVKNLDFSTNISLRTYSDQAYSSKGIYWNRYQLNYMSVKFTQLPLLKTMSLILC